MRKIIDSIKNWYTRERKILFYSAGLGFAFTVAFAFATNSYSDSIQGGIAKQVIRFHVLANSNSGEDQDLKLKVRDCVLKEFSPLLNESESYENTKDILNSNIDEIIACAKKTISESGYNYDVSAKVTKSVFPTKEYGDISFPAGEYEALRIEIGEGEGNNWWCVMFPPLCYVDVTQSKTTPQSKQELNNILTDEEYDIVVNSRQSNDMPVKFKFKVVEWWQELKNSFSL